MRSGCSSPSGWTTVKINIPVRPCPVYANLIVHVLLRGKAWQTNNILPSAGLLIQFPFPFFGGKKNLDWKLLTVNPFVIILFPTLTTPIHNVYNIVNFHRTMK